MPGDYTVGCSYTGLAILTIGLVVVHGWLKTMRHLFHPTFRDSTFRTRIYYPLMSISELLLLGWSSWYQGAQVVRRKFIVDPHQVHPHLKQRQHEAYFTVKM